MANREKRSCVDVIARGLAAKALQGGGSGGTSDHRQLSNRNAANQHPISAITGLQDALDKGTVKTINEDGTMTQEDLLDLADGLYFLKNYIDIVAIDDRDIEAGDTEFAIGGEMLLYTDAYESLCFYSLTYNVLCWHNADETWFGLSPWYADIETVQEMIESNPQAVKITNATSGEELLYNPENGALYVNTEVIELLVYNNEDDEVGSSYFMEKDLFRYWGSSEGVLLTFYTRPYEQLYYDRASEKWFRNYDLLASAFAAQFGVTDFRTEGWPLMMFSAGIKNVDEPIGDGYITFVVDGD